MRVFLFLLFSAFLVQSQAIELKGKIIDATTKEPISYANISFLKGNLGISSQENGRFNFEIPWDKLNEKVHISCLNYRDTIVLANQLQEKIVELKAKVYELEEVILSKKQNKEVILDKVKRRIIPMHSSNIKMLAKYFPNNSQEDFYFKTIKIHLAKKSSHTAKFRIRIFNIDNETGKPNKDLLLKSIPVEIKTKQKITKLDIESLNIEAPKNGFFVAFEKLFIPENEYLYKGHRKKKITLYAPIIGITRTKEIKLEDCKIYLYNKGKWWLSPKTKESDNWVPAISVTLTN